MAIKEYWLNCTRNCTQECREDTLYEWLCSDKIQCNKWRCSKLQKVSWGQSCWAGKEEMALNHLQVVVVHPHLGAGCLAFYLWKLDSQLGRIKGAMYNLILKPWLRSCSLFWRCFQKLGGSSSGRLGWQRIWLWEIQALLPMTGRSLVMSCLLSGQVGPGRYQSAWGCHPWG